MSRVRENGRFVKRQEPESVEDALLRFAKFCDHDPINDCVIWTGGKSSGHRNPATYGAFWYNGRRWPAHRWAAKFIHGLDIDHHHVDHCCPNVNPPRHLCVQHVQVVTLAENNRLKFERIMGGPFERYDIPYFLEPEWLREAKKMRGDCDDYLACLHF